MSSLYKKNMTILRTALYSTDGQKIFFRLGPVSKPGIGNTKNGLKPSNNQGTCRRGKFSNGTKDGKT